MLGSSSKAFMFLSRYASLKGDTAFGKIQLT